MPRPPIASPRELRIALLALGVVVATGLVLWHSQEPALTSTLAPKPESARTAGERTRTPVEELAPTRRAETAGATESRHDDAAAAEPTGPVLTVRLLDPLGQPIESFEGVLLLDGGPPSKLERRAGGRMTASVPASAGEVVVWCRTLLPTRAPVAAGATELDIAAEIGATLSGRITVEGKAWGEPFECVLSEQERHDRLRGVPGELLPESWSDDFPGKVEVAVAADGSFEVLGLDRDSPLQLDPPDGFSFQPLERMPDAHLDSWPFLDLEGPRTGVELDLVAYPALTGRIVAATPIDDIAVTLTFHTRRRDGSFRDETTEVYLSREEILSDERFRIVLGYVGWGSLDVALKADDSYGEVIGFARRTVARRTPGTIDLGDVELEPGPTFRYRLHDESGADVDKALMVGLVDGREGRWPQWADGADGTIGPFEPWIDELLVSADDFEPLVVPIAGRRDGDLLDLRFTRGSELVVRFRRPADEPPCAIELELAAAQPLLRFVGSSFESDDAHPNGAKLWRLGIGGQRGDDYWHIHGIAPGVRFRVRVIDELGAARCEQWLELASRERREIALTPYATAMPFAIEVVDSMNRPVAGARVEVRSRPDRAAQYCAADTDDHGIAAFEPLPLQVAWANVRPRQGFAPRELVPITLPKEGDALRLVVETAWRLAVEPGPSHAGIEQPWVEGHEGDPSWMAWIWTEKAWDFVELPAHPCTVCMRYAGRVFTQAVTPPTKRIRFDLPAAGQVVVRYDLPLPDALLQGRRLQGVTLVPIAEPTSTACEVSVDAMLGEPLQRNGVVEFPAVLPGRYRVALRWDEERPSFGYGFYDDEEERPLEKTERDETVVELEVNAGETTEASVRR